MKLLYIATFALFPLGLFAQGENDNWYFGDKAGLNFSTSPPTVLLDSEMNTEEAVGSISNSNGDLLFYTDGVNIWNREHQIMMNGTGLSGAESSQQLMILPYPDNSNKYFVFTMAEASFGSSYIAYSVVDMSLGNLDSYGNPLGGVITNSKNTLILNENGQPFAYRTEAVTAVLHSDNKSYWVLIPNGTKLYSYRLDNSGFNNNPVMSNLTFPAPFEHFGQIKISPRLSPNLQLPFSNFVSMVLWNSSYDMRVHSFNDATGMLTNDYELEVNILGSYSTEFISDGTLMYAGRYNNGIIYVFDLLSSNPKYMVKTVYTPNPPTYVGSIQRAKDNEIYISYFPRTYLSKVINPHSFSNASVDFNSILLSGNNCELGLPQLIPIIEVNSGDCPIDLVLDTPETKSSYLYETSNSITAYQNYAVNTGQNIILSAGNYIEMLPNTSFTNGSVVLAEIEGCSTSFRNQENTSFKPIKININLDDKIEEQRYQIYPNPSNGVITIANTTGGRLSYEVFNVLGRPITKGIIEGISVTLDLSNNHAGIYFIKLQDEQSNDSVIKKLVIE